MALFRCLNPATLSSIDGVKVLTGELEPTSTLGTNGDIYLQTGNEGALLHFDEDFTDEGEHTWTVAAGTGEVSDEQSKFGGKSLKLTAGILQSEDDDGVFIPGKEDFTVSLWVYPTVTSRIALFATQGTGIAMDLHYNGDANLWASSTGSGWNVIQSDSASAVNAGNGTITVNTNEWTHIAYVRKGRKCMSFVNGVLSKEVSISETADLKGSGQFNLGGWDNLSQYRYTGYIDDFMYLKGAALWDSAFTPPTEPMTLPVICKKVFRKIDNEWIETEGTGIDELGSFENPYGGNLKVLNGTAEPSSNLGNDGDIYLKAENDVVSSAYQKVNGTWQSLINSPINEKTIVEPMSIYSGSDAPTSILGKDNDLYLQNLTAPITFDDWTSQNEAGMTVTTTANDIQITYSSGDYIGAYAYKKIDFTNIKSITFKLKSGSHSYNNYGTKRFCPFLYLSDTTGYAVDTDADTPLGLVSRITADNTEITDTFDTSDVYGEKYLIFNSSGCTSTLESITFNYALIPQIKINGSWQDLANTSIEDIFFAKPIPAGIYGYTQLSYIKSDGSSWINPNLRYTTDMELEFGGRWDSVITAEQHFFGVWVSTRESNFGAYSGNYFYEIGGSGTEAATPMDTNYHIIKVTQSQLLIDDTSIGAAPNWNNVVTDQDIYMLCRNVTTTPSNFGTNFEFGYCKIWQGGNLIRDFVPCKRNYDNTIGLYDKVNDKFYQNNGTGEIIAGPAIPLGGAITYKNYVHFTDGIGFTLPFTINADYKITVIFNDTVYKLGNAIIDNTYNSNYLRFGGYQTSANNGYYSSRGSQVSFWGTWSSGTHTFVCNNGNNHSVFDGVEVVTYTPTTLASANIHLGGGDIHGEEQWTSPDTYISRFKIESLSTGDVICDLRPAIQGQSTHCMYDIINDIAYTSSGLEAVDDIS